MIGQVLLLRELLVLAQGSELKLALGLWCWLLWTGGGSLAGDRLGATRPPAPGRLGGLLALLGVLLPATLLGFRAIPGLGLLPWGQALPLDTAVLLFLGLLAPFCLASGYFFAAACRVLAGIIPQAAAGRVYYLETLGAALGVLLLQLLLLGRFSGLSLGLASGAALALAPWVLAAPRSLPLRLAAGAALALLVAAGVWSSSLETLSRSWQWPGRRVLAAVDSPYALLSVTREAEQVSFFANNLWQFTDPDPCTAEHQVQLGLLQHPQPRRVLLLGGGVGGAGAEVLKTRSVDRLDYVELDPHLIRLAREWLPDARSLAHDPRVRVIYQDARRFLTTTPQRYDVILMALPEPRNAQLNRFYTREFFRLAARRLNPQGVFSFALTGAETGLSPLRAAYLAMADNTLRQAFPQVLAFPGERVRWFAAAPPGTLVAAPQVLVQRLMARRLDLKYVREYYLLSDLSPWRLEYLRRALGQQPVELNTDLSPGCYFYDLALSAAQEGLGGPRLLLWLKGLPGYAPWIALGLGLALVGLAVRRRPGPLYLCQVLVMGLSTMALEILVLVLYQIRWGSLYRQLGLLIAAFMVGMAAGSALGTRLGAGGRQGRLLLAAFQGGLAALAALLAFWLSRGPDLAPAWDAAAQAGYVLLLVAAGFGGGGIFALGAAQWQIERPGAAPRGGVLYAADLLGATLGTLGVSLLVLPVWGILPALYGVAVLNAGAGAMLLAPQWVNKG